MSRDPEDFGCLFLRVGDGQGRGRLPEVRGELSSRNVRKSAYLGIKGRVTE